MRVFFSLVASLLGWIPFFFIMIFLGFGYFLGPKWIGILSYIISFTVCYFCIPMEDLNFGQSV